MGARTNMSLPDGLATPVTHVFAPNPGDGNVPGVSVVEYEDRSTGIQVGFPRVSISTRKPTKQNKNTKIVMTITVPKLETVSNSTVSGIAPAPTVAYACVFRGEFVLPERSDLPTRKDLMAYVTNLFAQQGIKDCIWSYDVPY